MSHLTRVPRIGFAMLARSKHQRPISIGFLLVLTLIVPAGSAGAHAALAQSEPAAGAVLSESPEEIRLSFTEPLEETYTGAELLDATGQPIPGVTSSIAPGSARELVVFPPPDLADGGYTVAWRTLSAADGHTLEGYFGFRVGSGEVGEPAQLAPAAATMETARALTRAAALLGLAALLASAPVTLLVLGPAAGALPGFAAKLPALLRRFGALAAALALGGSVAALAAQSALIAPEALLPVAMAQTLGETRYGRLWLARLALLLVYIATLAVALRGRQIWRRPTLVVATGLAIALPLPFSLLSHSSAQQDGRSAAVAADALHLLAAALWAGGLFMLVLVLVPALRPLTAEERRTVLRETIPRFSVIGLAAWGVLILTGLYASWLQVGTIEALRETPYGQSLLLKGALLLLILALAAFHLLLGKSDLTKAGARRFAVTVALEALLVVAVLLVVGRLIGLEPAREVLASRTPPELIVPLAFTTDDGPRQGQLVIFPGAAGVNTFTLEIDGFPLPEGSQGVLRFELPSQEMGAQQLDLPPDGPNRFRGDGPELALPGEWRIETIVRAIGVYSWATEPTVPVGATPAAAPELNPAPLFAPSGIAGMIAMAIGMAGLAAAGASRAAMTRRGLVAAAGTVALAAGALVLVTSRIPLPEPSPVVAREAPVAAATGAAASPEGMTHQHVTPVPASATPPGSGTAVSGEAMTVAIAASPETAGPTDVTVDVTDAEGAPLGGARVAVMSEMSEMAIGRMETLAVETQPGRYVAESVPLGMAGEWRLTVRVSPKGASTQVFPFAVLAP